MSITTRRTLLRAAAAGALLSTLAAGPALAYDHRYDRRGGYNDEYIFVATKAALDMNVHPVAKVPLVPATLILDLLALPFEIVAGFF
jgi:hypothetical protein